MAFVFVGSGEKYGDNARNKAEFSAHCSRVFEGWRPFLISFAKFDL